MSRPATEIDASFRLRDRRAFVDVGGSPAARPVAGARPRRPEDHREHDADYPNDQQNPADRVDVHARDVVRHRKGEDGTDGRKKDPYSETHISSPFWLTASQDGSCSSHNGEPLFEGAGSSGFVRPFRL